jgi:hypothetical protein
VGPGKSKKREKQGESVVVVVVLRRVVVVVEVQWMIDGGSAAGEYKWWWLAHTRWDKREHTQTVQSRLKLVGRESIFSQTKGKTGISTTSHWQ